MSKLLILVGAGASFDCGDSTYQFNQDFRPPLVNALFENRRSFHGILSKYPKAARLAPQIASRLAQGESIEDILRDFRTVKEIDIRRMYWEVPLYLQELLGEISAHFPIVHATRYDHLVQQLERSKYEELLYVTTNYDTFLEGALSALYDVSFARIDSYITAHKRWKLYKLHGSVNWGQRLTNGRASMDPFRLEVHDEDLVLDEIEPLSGHQGHHRFRNNGQFYFPALSVPVSGKTGFSCPTAHQEDLISRLEDGLDVLVIGFSAADLHVLEILKLVQRINRLTVVNGNEDWGAETIGRLRYAWPGLNPRANRDCVFAGGFKDFLVKDNVARYL